MCDFELEYNLSMHVYIDTVYVFDCICTYVYQMMQPFCSANFLDSVTLHSRGGGDFPRKSTNFKGIFASKSAGWVVFQNLLVIKNAPGELQAPWSLGGWTSNKKDKKTRVNETHLDQRLVNGLFHLYL